MSAPAMPTSTSSTEIQSQLAAFLQQLGGNGSSSTGIVPPQIFGPFLGSVRDLALMSPNKDFVKQPQKDFRPTSLTISKVRSSISVRAMETALMSASASSTGASPIAMIFPLVGGCLSDCTLGPAVDPPPRPARMTPVPGGVRAAATVPGGRMSATAGTSARDARASTR